MENLPKTVNANENNDLKFREEDKKKKKKKDILDGDPTMEQYSTIGTGIEYFTE